MVDPDRSLLGDVVEVDETEVPLRRKTDPIAGFGIPNVGKLLIIGGVEVSRGPFPGRLRLETLPSREGDTCAPSSSAPSPRARRSSRTGWRATASSTGTSMS